MTRLFFSRILSLIFVVLTAGPALAAMNCSLVNIQQRPDVKALVESDAYGQWLQWEATANLEKYLKPTKPVNLPVSVVSKSNVEIQVDANLPQNIKDQLIKSASVLWPKHPYDTSETTSFRELPVSSYMSAFMTASRSMALGGELRGFTIKMPTDHPHGPKGEKQPEKADTTDDVVTAMLHTDHIRDQDARLGADPQLSILPEVMTVADKNRRMGYIIRDVRKLDDGHYYLPALSIPYVGREIARINNAPFDKFWEQHYARALGLAKAKLLLRYGLQMVTPNPQNMLIQLDRNLKPTGQIVFRDVSDSFFVDGVAQELGFSKAVEKDAKVLYEAQKSLRPFVSNSMWRFGDAGDKAIAYETVDHWSIIHNRAYILHVLRELRVKKLKLIQNTSKDNLNKLYEFLLSDEGRAALKKYSEPPLENQIAN